MTKSFYSARFLSEVEIYRLIQYFGRDMDYQSVITIIVLLGVMVAFFTEKLPPHLAAMGAMAALLAFGVISSKDALSVFSNSAPITIACMCILSAALHSTGVIDLVGEALIKSASSKKAVTILLLMIGIVFLSAFMNNTPLVIIMTPVIINLAEKLKDYPSKYLIPLSYAAILGGTCTLIGTSTNILVDSIAQKYGQPAFSMFEITGAGLILAACGSLFLGLVGRHLLPERAILKKELIDEEQRKKFTLEALIPHHSKLIGKTINELHKSSSMNYEIIDLVRNEVGSKGSLHAIFKTVASVIEGKKEGEAALPKSALRDKKLKEGDRIIIKTEVEDLIEIRKQFGLEFGNDDDGFAEVLTSRKTTVAEAAILDNSTFIGKKVKDLRIRRRYGAYIIAIYRSNHDITGNLETVTIQSGDIILIEGPEKELDLLFEQEVLQNLTSNKHVKLNVRKSVISIATITAVVGLSALDVMDISGLSIIGALVVIFSGCISQDKAYQSIEWKILMMIFGMLALSQAIEITGIGKVVVEGLAATFSGYGPWVVLGMVYVLTSIATEVISNNAVAVLLTPIVIGLAQSMGVDARPFIVAVMFGASASFATPIGYQTNTFVYNAGNYRFKDFLKVGVPMNIIIAIVAITIIPFFWDF